MANMKVEVTSCLWAWWTVALNFVSTLVLAQLLSSVTRLACVPGIPCNSKKIGMQVNYLQCLAVTYVQLLLYDCESGYIRNIQTIIKKVKYMDLYSASSQSMSNALPFPISPRWFPQVNPTARWTLRDHVIRVGVLPVYSPGYSRYSYAWAGSGWVAWVPGSAPRWFTRPKTVTHLGTNRA